MSAVLNISAKAGGYDVEIGAGLLGQLGARMRNAGLNGRVALLSDANVAEAWGAMARASLESADYDVAALLTAPGEASKTLASAERLYGDLIKLGFGRGDTLAALGGGVVGDLGGFVAATYHRGMGFVQAPTTLLAQVDSSVGGKVAVDHALGKNLVGAFYPPRLVVADVRTLRTLPARERWSGLAEVVKAALIRDAAFLDVLEGKLEAIGEGQADEADLEEIIRRAVAIKADIVSEDEHETGARMLLNFGHTFGHALETSAGYGLLTHGEAIVHGMRVAIALSEEDNRLSAAEAARAQALLARFPAPPAWPRFDPDEVKAVVRRDKKAAAGRVRFIVLDKLGAAAITDKFDDAVFDRGARLAVAAP